MNTGSVRLNITLPSELVRSLDKLVGPRKRSRFIAETLKKQIKQYEKEELEKLLAEGYRATERESVVLAKEFESVDLEEWDEY